ncbi:hypothetical protein [Pedobacter steynii]|uniref:Uncharacterized protein n=1 Tax=Pedobacter steynii TaxID=430522 RepID=A0A1D7QIL8_9SPHI|nr:hypothetical protein [Pedobacter steynii]AOM78511.1 hypothetical protein BFS30_15795 [Pedobacter steynii]
MFKIKKQGDTALKKFVQKKLLLYIIPNVIFNTTIPYLTLRNLGPVYLFQGEYCFARFLLPMALFLPFIITFDMLRKTIILSEEGKAGFVLPDNFTKNKFMFKMAGANGAASLVVMLAAMLFVQLTVPEGYGFDAAVLSLILGAVAGTLTIISTLWPVKKVKELSVAH